MAPRQPSWCRPGWDSLAPPSQPDPTQPAILSQAGWEQLLCQPTPTPTPTPTLPPTQVEDGWDSCSAATLLLDGTDDSIDEAIRQLT